MSDLVNTHENYVKCVKITIVLGFAICPKTQREKSKMLKIQIEDLHRLLYFSLFAGLMLD
jgi:hypothetical protein